MNEIDEETTTEVLLKNTFDLYMAGVDPSLIYKILMEHKLTPAKAQSIMRWARMKAEQLGWL